ncbi:unnamed protein product [Rotaria socialis]
MSRAFTKDPKRRNGENSSSYHVAQSTDSKIVLHNNNQLFSQQLQKPDACSNAQTIIPTPINLLAASNNEQSSSTNDLLMQPNHLFCQQSAIPTTTYHAVPPNIQLAHPIDTINAPAVSQAKSCKEELVIDFLCKIILTIHARQEFVSVQRVEREIFEHLGIRSFHQIGVDQRNLTPLNNLIQRHKSVKLYMQVFEKVFNLCTLHDLGAMLAKVLKLEKYEDAHLGPLEEHPDIKRIFQYTRPTSGKAITEITTSNVINAFLDFQAAYRGPMRIPFDEFLEKLVKEYKVESREQLGIFCRSFPYLTEVTRKLTHEHRRHNRQSESDARSKIMKIAQAKFAELIKEVKFEFQSPHDKEKKSPTIVFDHLISIVEKYLVVSEQKILQDTLNKFRKDELLQSLFNVSICLGTMKKPEELLVELKKFYQYPIISPIQSSTVQNPQLPDMNQSPHNKQYQSGSSNQLSLMPNTAMRTAVDTSFANTLSATAPVAGLSMPVAKSRITLNQLCIDLSQYLKTRDSILTVKQWAEVEKTFCSYHGVENFFEFGMINEDDGGRLPLSLMSFLHLYRQRIDPNGQLSVYENVIPTGNRRDLYTFVNQLLRIHDKREDDAHANTLNKSTTDRPVCFSADQLSAIEKGVKHKFGSLCGFQDTTQIINKAKQQQQTQSMIYFEESLLDVVSLNRLSISSTTSSIDEEHLCKLILQCPVMTDLSTWLQWLYFFQPKYGSLKTFITRKKTELDGLLLLETSTHELFRLPIESSLTHFEQELAKMNVRSAVGYLCASIILEYVHVNRLPFSIYRQVMHTWFVLLQSSATFGHEPIEPMEYILEFLTYLPALVGQTLIVQELVLAPLDDVFRTDYKEQKGINNRQKLWLLANGKQKNKLEIWGCALDMKEWKNTSKWMEQQQIQIVPTKRQSHTTEVIVKENVQPDVVGKKMQKPISPATSSESYVNNEQEKRIISENDSVQAAFEHIESIRRGFGVNAGLDPTGQSIVSNLQGMIERSLEKLSNDLYSEQGHFVLELIQNADDNQYLSNRLPTLRFALSSERILVCNNEIGFRPMHISAICNVGASTKGKHKQGYAGHKGIGFKSVFMVSDCPEIYSGSYQFCFDTVHGTQQIGYIRPIWVDKSSEILPSNDEWITRIRLPIKQDKRGDRLQRNFDDIQPILLLFLNRLRRIEIIREDDHQIISHSSFTRIDHAQEQIIELQERTVQRDDVIKHFWLVVKKVIHVPNDLKMKLSEIKCDVESTTIAIAYPLNPIYECSSRQILSTQPLFAYLPLRSYGFRFILQADFEITAARQEVIRDNRWNDWLKSEMVQLFSLAYEQFQHLPELLNKCALDFHQTNHPLTKIQTLKYFLKLIPMRNEIDPYFNTFVDKSIQCLMGIIRLPVFCHDDEATIDWVLPSQCVLVRDPFIRKIFSQSLLLSHFNSYYLHDEFLKESDEQILIKLGCRRLDFADILKLIRTLYKQNDQIHSTKTTSIEQIAQWLLCIDYSLQQQRERPGFNNDQDDDTEQTTIAELKQLKIIPLRQQSQLVSIDEFENRTILFPPDKTIKYAKHLKIVLDDLPTIDDRLLYYIEDKYPRRLDSIKALLTTLGLCDARNVRRIYSSHIVPIIRDDSQWSKKPDATLIAYLICIYRELYALNPEMFAHEMEQIKKSMIIKTLDGKFVRLGSDKTIVHLTALYGCSKSLEHLKLTNHQFTFISHDYIQEYQNELFYHDSERRKFLAFLNELDLSDFFQMNFMDNRFANVEQLVNSPWENEMSSLSGLIHEPFIINDWCSNEFDALISSKDNDINQCTQLLLYLHQHHRHIAMHYVASVVRSRMRHMNVPPVKNVESSFLRSLRQHAWIPVVGGKLFKPSDVYYLPSNNLLRRYVPHLDSTKIPLKDSDFIFNILGLKKDITPITMFELFMKWSCNLDRDSLYQIINLHVNLDTNEPIPCIMPRTKRQSCLDKLENICQVYQMIITADETHSLLARFRLWPLVFIPRTEDMGDFLFADEVIWNDPHSLLETTNSKMTSRTSTKQYTLIQPYYGQNPLLKAFFINLLQVKQQPTLEDYLPLLSNVNGKKKDYIWRCIDVITHLAFTQNCQTLVREKSANWAFIPCLGTANEYHKCSDPIFYPHDMDIARLFSDILLIVNPSGHICTPTLKNMFCSMFGIPNLSDVIKILANSDNERPSMELTDFYLHTIDLIQSFLIKHNSLSETQSNYFQSVFARMKIVSVDRIRFSYSYKDNTIRALTSSKTHSSFIDESTGKFFILKTIEKPEKHISTLVNYLIENELIRQKLAEFIKNLFKTYQQKGPDGLTSLRQSLPLQSGTMKWVIAPVIKQPELLFTDHEETDDEQRISLNNASVNISDEAIENMKKESNCFPLKVQSNKVEGEGEVKPLVCFPVKPGTINLNLPSQGKKPQPGSVLKENNFTCTSRNDAVISSESTSITSKNVQEQLKKTADEQVVPNNNFTKVDVNTQPTSNDDERLSDLTSVEKKMSSVPTVFERIHISNIHDFNLSVSNVLPLVGNSSAGNMEDDLKTGRCGENFVFGYLQWKYPNEQIEWVNQKKESGLPYDIRLVHKTTNDKTELIEVKTTRSYNQNTFQMSIGQIECLLGNPDNYSIYRVHYTDDEKSSTITILSQVKVHLQKKNLALSMTIVAKACGK